MLFLDELVSWMCAKIFDPLSRSDQHKWARLYVRGLLTVRGRKTMRSMASLVGKRTVEQNLHHFISKSSWDWKPVRQRLAQHVDQVVAPKAWVVDEMVIPKRGPHSVGVERTFVPQLGKITNNQRAFGVWLATERESCPVNWRLMLPSDWVTCPNRRGRAGIPESLDMEPPDVCALNAALEMAEEWDIERRPLIMDARHADVRRLVTGLVERDVRFLIRISDSVDVAATDPSGRHAPFRPARSVADHLFQLRQPMEWHDARDSARRLSLAATMPVSMNAGPTEGHAHGEKTVELVLLAEWCGPEREPAALWLTDMDSSAAALVRLAKLPRQVAKDFSEVCTRVGIQDFEGRSFAGWHRHVTLVSAAHAMMVTAQAVRRSLIPRARTHRDHPHHGNHVLVGAGAGGRP